MTEKTKQNQMTLHEKTKITFKCEICDKEFKNNNGLKKHFNVVHNFVKEHQCNICQKVYKIQSQLTIHVKISHDIKKHHECDLCEKSFSRAWILKQHINSIHNAQ